MIVTILVVVSLYQNLKKFLDSITLGWLLYSVMAVSLVKIVSDEFLRENNLYRHENLNKDTTKKGFFGDDRRVKAIKFK